MTIDLKEVGPTYYFAPPRVFEGLLTSVMIRMEDAGTIKRKMFGYFMDVAKRVGPARMDGKNIGALQGLLYWLGDVMVYGPLRNNLGFSRVRVAYTAGEAIGPDLFIFYRSIGINLKQLYGSTETAVFVCLQPDNEARADTVGVPIRGVKIKVADNGEILVKSAGLLKGYYKNPTATAEVLTADGWYHTSDAGFLDAGGHLKIIDRVKDVGRIKGGASDGAMFAPKYVENKLKFFPFIKEAVAYGDGREKVCVMLNIDFDAVGNWAERWVLRHLVNQEGVTLLMATLGITYFLDGLGQTLFGSAVYRIDVGMPKEPMFVFGHVFEGGLLVNKEDLIAALVAVCLVLALSLFFRRTTTGRALRAVADDHQAAQSIGIPLNRMWVIVWFVAGLTALVAGIIWGSKIGVQFSLTTVALKALPVIILGGLTSVPGAIIGGLIIGVGGKLSEVFIGPFVGGGIELWFAYVLGPRCSSRCPPASPSR